MATSELSVCTDWVCANKVGIDCSIHQLRHRFGTAVYAVSKDIRVTQELLGNSSPTTTAVYAAFSPQGAVDAVNAITPRMAS